MKIYVAGHTGMVGSSIVREIENHTSHTWVGYGRESLDLLDRKKVFEALREEKPGAVIIAAAKVGGIRENKEFPVDFLSQNLRIQTNLLDAAHEANIEKVLFLGSSCIYPKNSSQPILEEALLAGELEPTNEAYAIAKIAGLKLVAAYRSQYGKKWISLMPTNLYGPGDNFDALSSHVIPGMITKFLDAKIQRRNSVVLWGTGAPLREFLHVNDLAKACILALEKYDGDVALNVGSGEEISIRDLASLIANAVGFKGEIVWDNTMPDGTPRKRLDSSRIYQMGWRPKISLKEGIEEVVKERWRTYESR